MKAFILFLSLAIGGCATKPGNTAPADRAAALAAQMVGKPYKYGGSSPSGFDCSGLVQYSFKHAGVSLPHNTIQQRSASRLVNVAELRRGDLLFFNQEGKKIILRGGGFHVEIPDRAARRGA